MTYQHMHAAGTGPGPANLLASILCLSRYLGPAASLNIAYQNNESYIAPSTLPRTDGETNLDTSTATKMIFRNELKCIHY